MKFARRSHSGLYVPQQDFSDIQKSDTFPYTGDLDSSLYDKIDAGTNSYTAANGVLKVTSNLAATCAYYRTDVPSTGAQFSQLTYVSGLRQVIAPTWIYGGGIVVRGQGAPGAFPTGVKGYHFKVSESGLGDVSNGWVYEIGRYAANVITVRHSGSLPAPLAPGDVLRIEVHDEPDTSVTVDCYINGVLFKTFTEDTSDGSRLFTGLPGPGMGPGSDGGASRSFTTWTPWEGGSLDTPDGPYWPRRRSGYWLHRG